MVGSMEIVVESPQQDVAVARLTGRLDFASAAEARGCFAEAIGAGHRNLIVDLSKVDFVDSAGLGSLIGGMRTARQAGGDLSIAEPTEQVRMLMSLTSLDQVLKMHTTLEEALLDVA
jgi:anti-sigma B factor antagonist